MALFQKPASTPDEIARGKPLAIPPEEVEAMDERAWYAHAFRGEAPQLTVRAVVTGTVLGFFLAFTNVYVSLKTGWAFGVSLTACTASYTVWTGLLRVGIARTPMSILETNCMQSTASAAGYGTVATVGTAVPAMLLLSVSEANPRGTNLAWWIVAPWILACAALGVMMAIPMKRGMINRDRLRFPTGTAAAALLRSFYTEGTEALARGRALLFSALLGVAVPVLEDLHLRHGKGLLPRQSKVLDWLPQRLVRTLDPKTHAFVRKWTLASEWGMTLGHGAVLVGAGAIVGLRTAVAMVAGALILAFGLGPVSLGWGWTNAAGQLVAAATRPGDAWKDVGTWFGAPLLVAYGLVAFALQFRVVGRAFASMVRGAGRAGADVEDPTREAEVPLRWFVLGTAAAGAVIVALAQVAFGIPLHYGALAVFACFFFALVACRACGETDLIPGGPLGKVTQLVYGVLIPQAYAANLMTASVTASTGLASADLLKDLKTGYLLGAHPRRQFVAQFLGIFTGTAATCIGYYALVPDATALTGTPGHPAAFPAPAAQQWKVVADLFRLGLGSLHPMARYGIAAGLFVGTLLAVAEWTLPNHRRWLPSATGLGLGLLLPFYISLSFLLGAVAAWAFGRVSRRQAERLVVPIASGLIAGESIVGVLVQVLNDTALR